MKKIIIFLLLFPISCFAFDTSVKGFIALDAINVKNIEGKKAQPMVGIGVLDLKVFAEQENMTAAMKLDLDGAIGSDFNIFEEAYATYRGIPDFKLSIGKGVVKFQNLHWGSIQNTYYDGGTVLETENSFRKLARKAYASIGYGGRSKGFFNTFWFWGDSSDLTYDEQGKLKYTLSSGSIKSYQTTAVKEFDASHQTGFANKIEITQFGNWTLSNGLVYYKKDVQKTPTYAIDFGANYETADFEFWSDVLFGHTQKLPFESYSTYSNDEYFIQLGLDKNISENWSWVTNTEFLYTRNQSWVYSSTFDTGTGSPSPVDSSFTTKSGQVVKTKSFKIETSLKYKLSKTSFITTGVLYESKDSEKNGVKNLSYIPGVYNANRHAYQALSSVSFWF